MVCHLCLGGTPDLCQERVRSRIEGILKALIDRSPMRPVLTALANEWPVKRREELFRLTPWLPRLSTRRLAMGASWQIPQ